VHTLAGGRGARIELIRITWATAELDALDEGDMHVTRAVEDSDLVSPATCPAPHPPPPGDGGGTPVLAPSAGALPETGGTRGVIRTGTDPDKRRNATRAASSRSCSPIRPQRADGLEPDANGLPSSHGGTAARRSRCTRAL